MRGLAGRVALITGAGRGIGRATALALAREGAQVVAVARSAGELESLREECGTLPVPAALDEPAGCAAAVAAARALGPIQILVNNAGIGGVRDTPAWELEPESWHATHAINLHAPYQLARLALPDMIACGWGRVVNVSSTSGERAAQYPEGRVLAPHEVAEVIAFLCSPRASGINGQAITVALGGVW